MSITKEQKVYQFYGNLIPYLFLNTAKSKGFIVGNHYYKEVEPKEEEQNTVEYIKIETKIHSEKTIFFKHLVNSLNYILVLILIFAAYNNGSLLLLLSGGVVAGSIMAYLFVKHNHLAITTGTIMLAILTYYGYSNSYYDIAYLMFFIVVISLIVENYIKDNIAYKVLGDSSGFYIWTDGKPLYTIEEKLSSEKEDGDKIIEFKG